MYNLFFIYKKFSKQKYFFQCFFFRKCSQHLKIKRLEKVYHSDKNVNSVIYFQALGTGSNAAPPSLYVYTNNNRFLFNFGEGSRRIANEGTRLISDATAIFLTSGQWRNMSGVLPFSEFLLFSSKNKCQLFGPIGFSKVLKAYADNEEIYSIRHTDIKDRRFNFSDSISIEAVSIASSKQDSERVKSKENYNELSDYVLSYICKIPRCLEGISSRKLIDTGVPPGPLVQKLKNDETVTLENGFVVTPEQVAKYNYPSSTFIVIEIPNASYLESLNSTSAFHPYQNKQSDLKVIVHMTPSAVMKDPRYRAWVDSFPPSVSHLVMNDKCTCVGLKESSKLQSKLHAIHPEIFPLFHSNSNLSESVFSKAFNCDTKILEKIVESRFSEDSNDNLSQLENINDSISKFDSNENLRRSENIDDSTNRFKNSIDNKSRYEDSKNNISRESNSSNSSIKFTDEYGFKGNTILASTYLKYDIRPPFSFNDDMSDYGNCEDNVPITQNEDYQEVLEKFNEKVKNLGLYENFCDKNSENVGDRILSTENNSNSLIGDKIYSDRNYLIDDKNDFNTVNLNNSILDKRKSEVYPNIVFLGTVSAVPTATRTVSCILLNSKEDSSMLLDCGEGSLNQLIRMHGEHQSNAILRKLKIVYVSHQHKDHQLGLISILIERMKAFREVNEPVSNLHLLVPSVVYNVLKSIESSVSFLRNVAITNNANVMKSQLFYDPELYESICSHAGLKSLDIVFAKHIKNSFSVAFTHKDGWKIAYSGDTIPNPAFINIGKDSDLLIHEATFESGREKEAAAKRHSTVSQAVAVGDAMNATFTILTHFSARYHVIPVVNQVSNNFGIAYDNMKVNLKNVKILSLIYPVVKEIFLADFIRHETKTFRKLN